MAAQDGRAVARICVHRVVPAKHAGAVVKGARRRRRPLLSINDRRGTAETLDYVADVVEGLRRAALPSGLDRDAAASFTNGEGRGVLLGRSEGMWLARDAAAS